MKTRQAKLSRGFLAAQALGIFLLFTSAAQAQDQTQVLTERLNRLERELKESRERENALEERLKRLEAQSDTGKPIQTTPPSAMPESDTDTLFKGLPPVSAEDQGRSASLENKSELAEPMRTVEAPFWQQGSAREKILGGFDVQGFVDARLIFDEDVLFDRKEMFDFNLSEVELDIIRRFPKYVFLRADIDFDPNAVSLEQGFAAITFPVGNGLTTRMGKFNSPIGSEPQDAPRRIFVNQSMVHEMGLPENFTGLMVDYGFTEAWKLYGILTNGWDQDRDFNENKAAIGRLEWTPSSKVQMGLSGGIGAERPNRNTEYRRFVVLDAIFTPHPKMDFTFDATWGSQDNAPVGFLPNGNLIFFASHWWGGQVTSLYRFAPWLDMALRYEIFRDKNGARVFEKRARTLVIKDVGTPILVNAISNNLIFHIVPGTDFNIEYQHNRSAGQDFLGLDGFLNHQENVITFQLESAF